MRKFAVLFFLGSTLFAHSIERDLLHVQAHLVINDPCSAKKLAEHALKEYPEEPVFYEWLIKSLARLADDSEMMRVWELYHDSFPEKAQSQELLEEMCWSILAKGKKEGALNAQILSLVGAALTQDMRAVPFLLEGMRNKSAHLRALSVELASFYGDQVLKEEIVRLYHEEAALGVRLEVIEALGKLKIEALADELLLRLEDPKTARTEKLCLIETLVEMQEGLKLETVDALSKARLGLYRELACEVVTACSLDPAVLLALMEDSRSEVCAAAIRGWGRLRLPVNEIVKRQALQALDPLVGITAAWTWLIDEPTEAAACMEAWLNSPSSTVRSLAAGAVKAAGPYGIPLAKKIIASSQDPYVQLNLAVALGQQREESSLVCHVLEEVLVNCKDQWMLTKKGGFSVIEKSTCSHDALIANYPEVINQTVRLDLLNLLAILQSPKALDLIKAHLKERKWVVNALAAQTLLGEGDETALDLVRELLDDKDPELRLEAALVLAGWGKDLSAAETLLKLYPNSDKQMKLKILDSIGRIGNKEMVPFLISCLHEPSLILKMAAASILIQVLNH